MDIQHSSRTDQWFTPVPIINRVRAVLGFIELDPASCAEANDIIGAGTYFDIHDDGLIQDWSKYKTIFLNPPGGKIGNKSQSVMFWQKLMENRDSFDHAIYMGFSIEQLAVSQGKGTPAMGEFPFCIPAKRIKFVNPAEEKNQPSHANIIVYVPGREDERELFADVFRDLGTIINT